LKVAICGASKLGMALELVINPDPLGDPRMIECYLRLGEFAFPGNAWTDFEWILEGWEEELRKLDRDDRCELWFADGPYQLNITHEHTDQYYFEFVKRTAHDSSVVHSFVLGADQSIRILAIALEGWRLRRSRH
jgi:hypothetical protein